MNMSGKFLTRNSFAGKQSGFSLIEALIAFLILSVGMLGIASLQMISLKAGKTAAYRTVAVIKVEEMFERIRNNPTQVINYASSVTSGNDLGCNDYVTVTTCNSLQMVAYDVYEWELGLDDSLTANAGVTTNIDIIDPVPGVQPLFEVIITVSWQERNPESNTMDTMSYAASADICNTTAC